MYAHVKRILDIVLSGAALVVLSPVMLLTALAVLLTSEGPVFFRQTRMGLHQQPFMIYKFRTMRVDAPEKPTREMKAQYITPVGRFLRASSLDELPQLVNIIKGDMSIVGPRPVILKEKKLIEARAAVHAYDVRPGLTGWAQINGRDRVSVKRKAALDGEYVQRMSFGFDVRCVLGTFIKVLRQEDVVDGAPSGR